VLSPSTRFIGKPQQNDNPGPREFGPGLLPLPAAAGNSGDPKRSYEVRSLAASVTSWPAEVSGAGVSSDPRLTLERSERWKPQREESKRPFCWESRNLCAPLPSLLSPQPKLVRYSMIRETTFCIVGRVKVNRRCSVGRPSEALSNRSDNLAASSRVTVLSNRACS
jgi:hypothetical protein